MQYQSLFEINLDMLDSVYLTRKNLCNPHNLRKIIF